MSRLNSTQVAAWLGASFSKSPSLDFAGVAVDSRRVRSGFLFVALPGARADGHDYLAQAQQAGAVAAIVSRRPKATPDSLPLLVVPDPLLALQELARQYLASLNVPVFGITGSLGKTSSKDVLAQLLGGVAAGVHAAPASYNSEIGLPLAILAAPPNTQRMILEYGINEPGEMEVLLGIARPNSAWLTPLAEVHLEGLGDLATIAQEKSKLIAAATSWWTETATWETLQAQNVLPLVVAPQLVNFEPNCCAGRPGHRAAEFSSLGSITVPLVADHELATLAVALDIARSFGVSDHDLRARAVNLTRPPGRLEIQTSDSCVVLNDAYNACPTSMLAALRVLHTWPRGSRLAVLGTMHELGPEEEAQHRAVGKAAAALPLDGLFGVGRGGAWIVAAAQEAGASFYTAVVSRPMEAHAELEPFLETDAVVLLKASRAEGLDALVAPLLTPVGAIA